MLHMHVMIRHLRNCRHFEETEWSIDQIKYNFFCLIYFYCRRLFFWDLQFPLLILSEFSLLEMR